MRDAESMLGQIISLEAPGEEIKLSEVKMVLGLTDTESVLKFVGFMAENKFKEAVIYLNEITFEGQDLEQFTASLIDVLRKITILKTNAELKKYVISDSTDEQAEKLVKLAGVFSEQELLWIFKKMISAKNEIKSAVLPQIPLELALIEYDMFKNNRTAAVGKKTEAAIGVKKEPKAENVTAKKIQYASIAMKAEKPAPVKESVKEEKIEKVEESEKIEEIKETEPEAVIEPAATDSAIVDAGGIGLEDIKNNWNQILKIAKKYNHSISAFLKLSMPQTFKDNTLTIATPYKFHAEKLNDSTNRKTIDKVLLEVFPDKKNIKVAVIQDENVKVVKVPEAAQKTGDEKVDAALDVFGGEVE
jgi:DNA polymerase III gamma/tau subunit